MTFFSTAERLEIGNIPFTSLQAKPGRAEALEYYRRVAQWYQLPLRLFEEVKNVQKDDEIFTISTSKAVCRAKAVIVATGFYDLPVRMNVPGEDLPKVTHYYKEAHYYAFQKVLVVGANNSAVDAALETWRKGAEVSMLFREAGIGERVKYWVRPDIINRIEEGSIKAYPQSQLLAIRPDEVDIATPNGVVTLANDFVIAMTGYQPNGQWLRSIGIQLSADEKQQPVYNPASMETNVPGLYLAGVVCGGMDTHKWFIENSREHAQLIVADLQKKWRL
jgi:thioredoxin reductase (NADPH)